MFEYIIQGVVMSYIEKLESVDKKMIVEEKGLKITEDAILLSEFIKLYFNTRHKNPKEKKILLTNKAKHRIKTI